MSAGHHCVTWEREKRYSSAPKYVSFMFPSYEVLFGIMFVFCWVVPSSVAYEKLFFYNRLVYLFLFLTFLFPSSSSGQQAGRTQPTRSSRLSYCLDCLISHRCRCQNRNDVRSYSAIWRTMKESSGGTSAWSSTLSLTLEIYKNNLGLFLNIYIVPFK